jgi:uncharacterized protein (DUF111 family)
MTISALVDAGCPFATLMGLLRQLPVDLPSIEPEKRRRGAIEGTYLRIGHSNVHFSVGQMRDMIDGLRTEERVKRDARGILDVIVNAESKVHGVPKEEVHFHELSHIDTIIDILVAQDAYSREGAFRSLRRGSIKTAHGHAQPTSGASRSFRDFRWL